MESKSKKNKNIPKPLKKKNNKTSEVKTCGEGFSVTSLISKFITNIFENNFSEADKTLQTIVEEKTKNRVRKAAKAAKNKAKKGKPDFLDVDDDGDTDEPMKTASKGKKGKLSKAENKKRFLEMIKNKKNSKKGNK
jgi:hypothetical protein